MMVERSSSSELSLVARRCCWLGLRRRANAILDGVGSCVTEDASTAAVAADGDIVPIKPQSTKEVWLKKQCILLVCFADSSIDTERR